MTNIKGAPLRDESLKISSRLTLNFTPDETSTLKKKNLYNINVLKSIIFQAIRKDKIIIKTNKDPNYLKSLNKIGSNLNQIAKKANSINDLSKEDVIKLMQLIDVITETILEE